MTRKNALKEAIKVVKNAKIDPLMKKEIIEKLDLCVAELPFAKWTKEAIFDACDQFIEDNQRSITTTDFNSANLPSHPTIKNRFGMTAAEFRDTYYPLPDMYTSKYKDYKLSDVLQNFKEEFARCGARTREDYDRMRNKNLPCSATVLKHAGTKLWDELLHMVGLAKPPKPRKEARITFTFEMDFERKLKEFERRYSSNA